MNIAFLNAQINNGNTIYVKQLHGFQEPGKEDWVCLLNKALYGLKQSLRAWFMCIVPVLVGYNFKQCDADSCIFVHTNEKGEKTYIALYVDDFLIAGENEVDIAEIKCLLATEFDMKDLGIANKFLGMEIEYGSNGSIKIHQKQYARELLARHSMQDCSPVTTPLDTSTA